MIRYDLICAAGHNFEGWFSSSADFDKQRGAGQIPCAICASPNIDRAIMAPNVSTSRQKEKTAARQAQTFQMVNEAAEKIRREIAKTCDDVGDSFAEEARAIHYGEKPQRGIYGQASAKDAAELREEGVTALPLPDILSPHHKTKSN